MIHVSDVPTSEALSLSFLSGNTGRLTYCEFPANNCKWMSAEVCFELMLFAIELVGNLLGLADWSSMYLT